MNQTQLSFSEDDAALSQSARQLPRKNYAQMHNERPVPAHASALPKTCMRGQSVSPSPNHCTPAQQRSPIIHLLVN